MRHKEPLYNTAHNLL